MTATPLWLSPEPLLLASTSATRRALVEAAGLSIELEDPRVDERSVEAPLRASGASTAEIALHLARAKALAVSRRHPGRLVLGGDQTLACGDADFTKPKDRAAAHDQLARLAGRTHHLHSAAALARDGAIVFDVSESAALTMRAMEDDYIARYLAASGDAVLRSVGGYQLEGIGVQLFAKIEGDHFTILGLPLLPVLEALRREGCLAA
jgi:septum formation protein